MRTLLLFLFMSAAGCGRTEVAHEPPRTGAAPPTGSPALLGTREPVSPPGPAPPARRDARATDEVLRRAQSAGCGPVREAQVVAAAYSVPNGPVELVGQAGLTDTGRAVVALLSAAKTEGLDPQRYGVDRFQAVEAAYARAHAAGGLGGAAASEAAANARACWEVTLADALAAYLRDGALGNTATEERRAIEALAPATPDGAAPEPEAASEEHGGGVSAVPGEATVPPFSVPPGVALPPVLADRGAFLTERLAGALRGLVDQKSVEALAAANTPRHPQYAPLRAALARYRALEAAGGFVPVAERGAIKPGAAGPGVRALQARLAQEGEYTGAPTGTFDAATQAAVSLFQGAHQLVATGKPDPAFWRAIDVPVFERVETLVTALMRVRRSRIDEDSYYVTIVIPDFSLEVWREGKRVARHRVVVGRTQGRACDEKTATMGYQYATPIQSAEIKRIVFAPYWNVTRTIKEQELDPQRATNPAYYEQMGYEVVRPGEPREWVRALPGPGNALGFVKFLFPNPFDTYVHDTPSKNLFERPVRASSHGCMRVDEPLDLAQLLLTGDGQWDAPRYTALRESWRGMARLLSPYDPANYERAVARAAEIQTTVDLRAPIPIHVEYFTARVGDDGLTNFLTDIYTYDAQFRRPVPPRRCIPESRAARVGLNGVPDTVTRLEADAQQLGPRLERLDPLVAALAEGTPAQQKLAKAGLALKEFPTQHRAYADDVRLAQRTLVAELEDHGGRWSTALQNEAVRLRRMVAGLGELTRQTKLTLGKLEAAAPRPSK